LFNFLWTFSLDENRPTSASKSDQKKGKSDGTTGRSTSVNPRRSATGMSIGLFYPQKMTFFFWIDQTRTTGNTRGKKLAGGGISSSKKSISMVKEEDEHTIEGVNINQTIQFIFMYIRNEISST
jgi:hypothetical protein